MEANDSSPSSGPTISNASGFFSKDTSFDDAATIPGDSLLSMRIVVTVVYSLVSAVALTGNVLVMQLIRARAGRRISTINVFVFTLALTDFQFALTLPFWAVEVAMDFSWPFGSAMCKVVLTFTVLNVYTTVFLLTAMSITRYWSVASAVNHKSRLSARAAKWISLGLWLLAAAATVPTAIFATVSDVFGEKLCLLKFPKTEWLAVYHIQKLLVGFIIPLTIITVSYLLLLSFLRQHYVNTSNPQRQTRTANSIKILVLVFFVCWFLNHLATFWGVLVKLEVVEWEDTFYFFQTYIFPLATCLAHSNSCLNPIIYCLMRKEFRRSLKATFWRISNSLANYLPSSGQKVKEGDMQLCVPLDQGMCHDCQQHISQTGSNKTYCVASTTVTTVPDAKAKDSHQQNHPHEADAGHSFYFKHDWQSNQSSDN
ncbi:relaxin-3 receptor 2 [Lissotriton helveticus]